MALSKQQKEDAVSKIDGLLSSSKMTVAAKYTGLGVKQMQELRRDAKANGVAITVVKNRLVKVALKNQENLKDLDTASLEGQLAYAFSLEDEVAAPQVLARFAKDHPELEFVTGFNEAGEQFSADQIVQLSKLPSKDVMRGQLVGTIAAPLSGFMNVMSGNIRGLANVLNARKAAIEN